MISTERRQLAAKVAVSLFILFILALQGAASTARLHRFRYWPFLSYPMYNRPHYAGDAVPRYSLVGIKADGTEMPIPPEDLGLEFWRYLKGPVRAAQDGDAHRLMSFLQVHEHHMHEPFAAIRLENHPVGLVDGKPAEMPVESKTVSLRHR